MCIYYHEVKGLRKRNLIWSIALCCCLVCIHSKAVETAYEVNTQVLGEDKKPIVGALFSVYKNGDLVMENLTSDHTGNVKIPNVTRGEYVLHQDSSTYGYQVENTPVGFTIDKSTKQKIHIKAMINKRIYGDVRIQLQDDEHNILSSFPISIMDNEKRIVKKLKSDENGDVHVKGLPVGVYTIHHENKKRMDQERTSFSITPYNSNTQYKISLQFVGVKNIANKENFLFITLFVSLLMIGISFLIYFFRKRSFTQFLDDFMI